MTSPIKSTSQLEHWRGTFGDAYTERNTVAPELLRARVRLWAEILKCLEGDMPGSVLEVGANIGQNLRALAQVTAAERFAIEPNASAREVLLRDDVLPAANLRNGVAQHLGFADASIDLVFTSGVLIHIHPDDLPAACREIHRVARRYIVCAEYFSDKPEEVPYRGHDGLLFKRDFGGYWLDLFPQMKVRGYGFAWRRLTGLDNLTWWVFEK